MLPSGLVTFVFTDIEGSTGLAWALGDGYSEVLHQHRRVLRACLDGGGGSAVDILGDSCFYVFASAGAAVWSCRAAQRALAGTGWPAPYARPRVRIGLHSGYARPQGGEYASVEVHRAARVTAAGHGDQVVCSAAAARHAAPLPGDLAVRDLGCYRLRGFDVAEQLFQLVAPGWEEWFPPPRAEPVPAARRRIPEPLRAPSLRPLPGPPEFPVAALSGISSGVAGPAPGPGGDWR